MKVRSALLALALLAGCASSANAEDLYRRGVLNYQAHHYSAALADFEKLAAAYPNNAMVRYYRDFHIKAPTKYRWQKRILSGLPPIVLMAKSNS